MPDEITAMYDVEGMNDFIKRMMAGLTFFFVLVFGVSAEINMDRTYCGIPSLGVENEDSLRG